MFPALFNGHVTLYLGSFAFMVYFGYRPSLTVGLMLFVQSLAACTVLFERRLGCLMETPPEDVQEFIHATRTKFVVTSPLMAAPVGLFAMLKPPVWKSYLHAENVIHETSK